LVSGSLRSGEGRHGNLDPKKHQPVDFTLKSPPEPDVPGGPVILTFTLRLPFVLGITDAGYQDVAFRGSWANPDDIAHFGKTPIVRLRLHNEPTDGTEFLPKLAGNALRGFYGDAEGLPGTEEFPPVPGAYEQWVTLETPSARLASEDPEDGAYAFHRSLEALNLVLYSMELSMTDLKISTVSTREVGAIVYCGALIAGSNKWVRLSDLLMHPDRFPITPEPLSYESLNRQLSSSFTDIYNGRLFLVSASWYNRARRAFGLRGDNADTIVSLQTAAESMMYDLLRGLLVDDGKTTAEISSCVNSELHFRTLLTRTLPPLLGGDWKLTGGGTLAIYWQTIYLVRNRVVHAGYTPTIREAEQALEAFLKVREYVSELLWAKHGKYPRTLLAKVGENGLVRRGWMSEPMRQQCHALKAEPSPFYWPRDIAARQNNS
jgi:hypothetical protein